MAELTAAEINTILTLRDQFMKWAPMIKREAKRFEALRPMIEREAEQAKALGSTIWSAAEVAFPLHAAADHEALAGRSMAQPPAYNWARMRPVPRPTDHEASGDAEVRPERRRQRIGYAPWS